jgi:hypothetical protein
MKKIVFGASIIVVTAAVVSLGIGSLIEEKVSSDPIVTKASLLSPAERTKLDSVAEQPVTNGDAISGEMQPIVSDEGGARDNVTHRQSDSGEEIDYAMKIAELDFHSISGRATSEIGDIKFRSKLLPSNEVQLELTLERKESERLLFKAYFDLANFVMELDGAGAVLDAEHKELLRVSSSQLTSSLIDHFEGSGIPEHGFMLIQMLSYWSNSPEGYVHEKHIAASN